MQLQKNESSYRPDIDGLRAIAVLSVILFHADISYISGGFVGVDIFFVISGFLITQLVLTDVLQGNFSFKSFYIRRARRLLPAFFFVLALVSVGAFLLLSPRHFIKYGESLLASLFSVSNIYFWKQSGYFDTESIFKPLLHVWSLSVEEQFYLVWPLLITLLALQKKMLGLLSVALIASTSLLISRAYLSEPSTIFYLTPFRVLEFCVGGLIIWMSPLNQGMRFQREFVALLGLLMILYSVFAYSGSTQFPYVAALIPCVGTAFIIYAKQSTIGSFLGNPVLVFVGRISYSLYLVHWPIFVFYKYWKFEAAISGFEVFALLAFSLGLATLIYYFIEEPFRRGRVYAVNGKIFTGLLLLFLLGLSSFGYAAWREKWVAIRVTADISDQLKKHMNYPVCLGGLGICEKPAKAHDIVLIGDSHSNAVYFYGALGVASKREIFAYTGLPACFPVFNNTQDCEGEMNRRIQNAIENKVRTVFLVANWSIYTHQYQAEWLFEKLTKTMAMFRDANIQVYVWGSMPFHGRDPASCFERPFRTDCQPRLTPIYFDDQIKFNNALRAIVTKNGGRYFDLFKELCNGVDCAVGIEGISLYSDRYHIWPGPFIAYIMEQRQDVSRIDFDELFR